MRVFTFDTTINPGRSALWNVREEAARLADQGMNGLAGLILRDGYSILPAAAVLYVKNADKVTMAALCAEIIAGLDTRRSDKGAIKPIINGTTLELFKRRLADISDHRAAGIVLDGRRRTIASIVAYGCGRDDVEMQGVEASVDVVVQASGIKPNVLHEAANKLDPWAKIEAGEGMMALSPTLTEAEILAQTGVKRGDGQLIHRAASAIRKHGLTPDRAGRCPSKEEWKAILDCATGDEARAMLATLQTGTRAKALGLDVVIKALSVLPEGKVLDARKLAEACKSRETLDAFLA